MPEHGLIVGRFDPPHRGHRHLIETALAQTGNLTIIVCERDHDFVAGRLRRQWLCEMFPSAEVMVIEDHYPSDDSALWASLARQWLGKAPDVVFTSEDYGEGWAAHLGCRHVSVDRARTAVPISATQVREDPYGCWEYIDEPVRAHLAVRVVVVGAESTGTTTLARALGEAYDTVWVPEYGREYSEAKFADGFDVEWRTDEFVSIARVQAEREDLAARHANRILVCDTDPLATCVWHERYLGTSSAELERIAKARRVDLHILTGDEIPFVQDGLRDGEHIRTRMQTRFREVLTERGGRWAEVRGSPDQRIAAARAEIEPLLGPRSCVPSGDLSGHSTSMRWSMRR